MAKKAAKKTAARKKAGSKKVVKKATKPSGNKTVQTSASVKSFLAGVDSVRRADCEALVELMSAATGAPPKMWGGSIVGFGDHHLVYDSGREVDWFYVGFSPRKANLSIYLCADWPGRAAQLEKLGPHKTGKSCVYVKSLDGLHAPTLKRLVKESVKWSKKHGMC